MLEIKIIVPVSGQFEAMQTLGSRNGKIAELISIPGTKIELKTKNLEAQWTAEGLSALYELLSPDGQTGKRSAPSDL